VEDCLELADRWKVDICLPSHLNQGNVKPNIPADRTDYRVWIDRAQWGETMRGRAAAHGGAPAPGGAGGRVRHAV